MQWPGILRQGLSPALAVGIIAASIVTAVTTKSDFVPAENLFSNHQGTTDTRALWQAASASVAAPVTEAYLNETGDITGGAWVETTAAVSTVGRVYGKLVVTREFGPSDESDARDIIERPGDHIVAVSIGFKPFVGENDHWFWARFSPDGRLIDTTGQMPSAEQLASIATAFCSVPLASEVAARS